MTNELNFLEGDAPEAEERAAISEEGGEARSEPVNQSAPIAPGHVPLAVALDERERRQTAERELAVLREQLAPPMPVPLEEHVEARLYAANLNASRRFAEREHGRDAIGAVHEWAVAKCDADPLFNQQMRSSDDPYEAALLAYNRERVVAEVSAGDLEAFRAWKSLQGRSTGTQTSPPNVPVPRSLATAPGNGAAGRSAVPASEGTAYAGLFK